MNTQQFIDKQPMPLQDFIHSLGKLAKAGKWIVFKEAVEKRKEWFEKNGNGNKF